LLDDCATGDIQVRIMEVFIASSGLSVIAED